MSQIADRFVTIILLALALSMAANGCCGSGNSKPSFTGAATKAVQPRPPLPGTMVAGTGAVASNAMIMAESAQFWPEFKLTCGGVPFDLGVDEGGVIRYVSTTDTRFATPEGVHVGSDYRSAMAAAGGQAAVREPGWAYYVDLPSGWRAAFVTGPSMTDGAVTAESPVRWLFQRIGYGSPATTKGVGF